MVPVYANNRSIASAETQIFAAQDVLILINGESWVKSLNGTGSKGPKDVPFGKFSEGGHFYTSPFQRKDSSSPIPLISNLIGSGSTTLY